MKKSTLAVFTENRASRNWTYPPVYSHRCW